MCHIYIVCLFTTIDGACIIPIDSQLFVRVSIMCSCVQPTDRKFLWYFKEIWCTAMCSPKERGRINLWTTSHVTSHLKSTHTDNCVYYRKCKNYRTKINLICIHLQGGAGNLIVHSGPLKSLLILFTISSIFVLSNSLLEKRIELIMIYISV